MSLGTDLYKRLPVWVQHGAVSAYGAYWHWLRFGGGYRQELEGYLERERFEPSDWARWQHARVSKLLQLAATNIPYYRRTWTAGQVKAAFAGELRELPLLDKEPIRAAPSEFLRDDWAPRPRFGYHTSGSTGTPIRSEWSLQEIRSSLALREARSARWAGVSFSLPRATFSGRMVEPDPNSRGPFYRYNLAERQVYLSPFHLRPDTARSYVEALRRHGIQWLTGYAVSYYLLARMIQEQRLKVPPLRAIVTTSEKVTSAMRQVMEDAYQAKVYEEYSTVESALFASACSHGRLHVSPDAGIVEIVRPDGTPCEPGEAGEVVATCLLRWYQIFIRYRLGDVASWSPDPCPCGLAMPVIQEVLGRVEDVVVGPDGRQLVRFHGIFVDQPHIREGQIIQEGLNLIRVKVVATDGFGGPDVTDVVRRVQQRLGPGVNVKVERVESIPRSKSGKFQAVISLLPKREAERVGVRL
ncbi:MAG: hypothetical protein ABI759_05915 [Candidatus Solibacter sp.]